MLENILKYLDKNRNNLLALIGAIVVIAIFVHTINNLVLTLVKQSWFKMDPLMALVAIYAVYQFKMSLKKQGEIAENQQKLLERLTNLENKRIKK